MVSGYNSLMRKLSLAYFGTPDFSASFLEKILNDKELPVEVKLVVTQEDKPVGRKQIITPSPVKLIARKYGIQTLDTQFLTRKGALPRIREVPNSQKLVSSLLNMDLALLFAYGEIISRDLLKAPKHGFWNIHPSLLPKYRGASPVAFPLINGDKETGVTIIQMDKELDHGPIIAQEKVEILSKERKDELTNRLTEMAFELFKKKIGELRITDYGLKLQPQDDSKATYTKLLTKKDGFVEFLDLKSKIVNHPQELFNMFRGLYPWPGLWTRLRSFGASGGQAKRLKIIDMDLVNGKLVLKKVQLEGKKEVDFNQFNEIYRVL